MSVQFPDASAAQGQRAGQQRCLGVHELLAGGGDRALRPGEHARTTSGGFPNKQSGRRAASSVLGVMLQTGYGGLRRESVLCCDAAGRVYKVVKSARWGRAGEASVECADVSGLHSDGADQFCLQGNISSGCSAQTCCRLVTIDIAQPGNFDATTHAGFVVNAMTVVIATRHHNLFLAANIIGIA